jgi:hypothetical protein
MNTTAKLTLKQEDGIYDFLNTSFANGLQGIAAYLPSNHPYIRNNKVSQIRTIKNVLAKGYDELGNEIRLTRDLRIIQD